MDIFFAIIKNQTKRVNEKKRRVKQTDNEAVLIE
jgi:hypothetical protein